MISEINRILADSWKNAGVEPGPRCSDLQFLRRITLDLAGVAPSLDEIRTFEATPDREAKVAALLTSDRFPKFWSEVWTAILNGYAPFETDREALRNWLEVQFRINRPYDDLVTHLITTNGPSLEDGSVNFLARYGEDAAVRVSRLFLGVRLDCARCHDHPFDRWKEEDFANMTRFFSATDRQGEERNIRLVDEIVDARNKPVFLTGAKPRTTRWRDELALMMTHTNAFAKTFGNRLWYQLIGRGIVDPPDDFNKQNPPSLPEMLDLLASTARETGWDMRTMISEICLSDAYQKDSATGAFEAKPVTLEQLLDSLCLVLDWELPEPRREILDAFGEERFDEDFSETWQYRETAQQLMQRLALDFRAPTKDLEELFLRILTRRPTQAERDKCQGFSTSDVAFALVNTNEFNFNH